MRIYSETSRILRYVVIARIPVLHIGTAYIQTHTVKPVESPPYSQDFVICNSGAVHTYAISRPGSAQHQLPKSVIWVLSQAGQVNWFQPPSQARLSETPHKTPACVVSLNPAMLALALCLAEKAIPQSLMAIYACVAGWRATDVAAT